ncbi:hypothetical protein [Niveispirillum sp.]|nr:hypothetical protein [Niveispirillum sp.]MBP7334369.1 hypothetical protein [Niveispirillum sp.]
MSIIADAPANKAVDTDKLLIFMVLARRDFLIPDGENRRRRVVLGPML